MIQLLGWIGSGLIVLSLTSQRQTHFRLLNLCSAVVLLFFNYAIGLWSMVALNATILIVNLHQLRRQRRPVTAKKSLTRDWVSAPPAEGWYTRPAARAAQAAQVDDPASHTSSENRRKQVGIR
jgi:hypothetical protein